MAKKRGGKSIRFSKSMSNLFSKNLFQIINKDSSTKQNYTYLAILAGFVVLVIIMNGGSYQGINQITGSTIEDVTGAASGITPITDMLKDLIGAIVGPDGMLATLFTNLTTGATWLPAVAVIMLISALFYILLRKSIITGDEHKKAVFIISLGLGLLSIGITIDGQTIVDWFKNLISGTISLTVVLVIGFAFWIFSLWGIRKSSSALSGIHEASTRRLRFKRGKLGERYGMRQEGDKRADELKLRRQQSSANNILAGFSAQYNNAKIKADKSIVEREFRTKIAKECPDMDPGQILKEWRRRIR